MCYRLFLFFSSQERITKAMASSKMFATITFILAFNAIFLLFNLDNVHGQNGFSNDENQLSSELDGLRQRLFDVRRRMDESLMNRVARLTKPSNNADRYAIAKARPLVAIGKK